MAPNSDRKNRPIELLEESLQILRTGGAAILLQYWTGSVPFAICLLLLVQDMGRSWGAALLLKDSLICAAAFVWLSYWKCRASQTVFALLSPTPATPVTWLNRVFVQAVFQTLKLFVMPLAMASILAWPAASAFFRALALEPNSQIRPLRNGFQRAFTAASARYKENALAFLTIAALALVTFLNVLVLLLILPSVWRMLTGYETDWSRLQGAAIFSVFTVACVTTWLLVDPWIQTYCLLRVFYQNAREDGRDLIRAIARLAALLLICLFAVPVHAQSAAEAAPTQKALNQAIDHASQDGDYGWLRPRISTADTGFLGEVEQEVNNFYAWAKGHVDYWLRSFRNWLRNQLRTRQDIDDDESKSKPRAQALRWTLISLAVLICGAIVAFFLRRRKTSALDAAASHVAAPLPDVLNEKILPSDVSQEEWLRLAMEYLANNQTRLAARAFYLANLSYLGTQSLLSLSLFKSNRLYERELARRPNSAELSVAFVSGNRLYERAWYGMRELGADQMQLLQGAVDQLRQHA